MKKYILTVYHGRDFKDCFLCRWVEGFDSLWMETFPKQALLTEVVHVLTGTYCPKYVDETFRKPFIHLVEENGQIEITGSQFCELLRRVVVRGQTVQEAWEEVKLQEDWKRLWGVK